MDEIWLIVRSLNQYIERVQPWQVAKNRDKDPEAESHFERDLSARLWYVVASVRHATPIHAANCRENSRYVC